MALSCGCDATELVPRFRLEDGTYVYPEVDVNGVYTVDIVSLVQSAESDLDITAGNGIAITPDSEGDDHSPTVSMCIDPNSPVTLSFVNVNGSSCLSADATGSVVAAETPNTSAYDGQFNTGILLQLAGPNNRDITVTLALGPDVPYFIDHLGRLAFNEAALTGFTCADLAGCSIGNLSNVNIGGPGLVDGAILLWSSAVGWFYPQHLNSAMMSVAAGPPGGNLVSLNPGTLTNGDILSYSATFLTFENLAPAVWLAGAFGARAGASFFAVPGAGGPVQLTYDPGANSFYWS